MKKSIVFFLIAVMAFPAIAARKKGRYVGRKVASQKSRTTRRQMKTEGLEMRKKRRVAIGTTVGGALGFLGVNLELNINERTGFIGGYGGGPGYESFTLQMKQYIAGDSFLPFIGVGFSRWFNSDESKGEQINSTPNFLVEKFLSEDEKKTGVFGKNIIYSNIGAQYVNLSGSWAGFSLFGEVMLMVDLESFKAAPNAAAGMMYYF